jgi:probable phosphoglycerate mutase
VSAARVLAWRHGRTAYNLQARLQGQIDIPLDEVGRWQARMAAATMLAHHEPAAIISSDLIRAQQTASYLARATGLPVSTDPRLRERSFGIWEGMSGEEITATWPQEYARWRSGLDPQGVDAEERAAVGARVAAAIAEHAAALAGGTLVVVSHGSAIASGLSTMLGVPDGWHGLVGMRNAHWANVSPAHGPVDPAWRLHGYNLGPTDASRNWDAGPDPEPSEEPDAGTRDPD